MFQFGKSCSRSLSVLLPGAGLCWDRPWRLGIPRDFVLLLSELLFRFVEVEARDVQLSPGAPGWRGGALDGFVQMPLRQFQIEWHIPLLQSLDMNRDILDALLKCARNQV